MEYEKHLYMVLYPNQSLIASHFEPEMFAKHYTTGSSRHYSGKVIFAEVDAEYRNDFLDIENIMNSLVPHDDGRPKATKFIASYRVLEHVEFSALGRLYISTQEGYSIGLEQGSCDDSDDINKELIRIYAEIAPMRMLVMSKMNSRDFGRFITRPDNHKSAPKQFYTQLNIDVPRFMDEFEKNPFNPSPIPSLHPSTIRDGFLELMSVPDKENKGLTLDSSMNNISYRLLKNGFAFASSKDCLFYDFPDLKKIEAANLKFWRTM